MSGSGEPNLVLPNNFSLRLAIVYSSWHKEVVDELLAHSIDTAKEFNLTPQIYQVTGSLEIPVVVKEALKKYDAVVALGVVVKGETPHFKYVCENVCRALTNLSLEFEKPVANGVLTVNSLEQAFDRAGGAQSHENKGRQATLAALATFNTLKEMR